MNMQLCFIGAGPILERMNRRTLLRLVVSVVVAVATFGASPAWAYGFLGWAPLADVHVSSQCSRRTCQAPLPTDWRHPAYALATDAPHGLQATGRLAFVCKGGTELGVLLPTIPPSGGLATVGNPCPNFEARRVTLQIEDVSIPAGDEVEGAHVRVFGALN
jgi:hypothetical protein